MAGKGEGVVLHGLASCDTCRKARKWLDAEGTPYRFRDFATDAPAHAEVKRWVKAVGADKLLNKSSTTWRSLAAETKSRVDESDVVALLAGHPKLMKRPIIELNGQILSGFDAAEWSTALRA